jgi:urease gamma subunit
MEVLPFIALTVTVGTLATKLTELLRDGKHVSKYLQETRNELETLKNTILRVQELLDRPDMESNFADSSAVKILEAVRKDFESCQQFISEFLSSDETTSIKARFKRIAVPNRKKDSYAALRRKLTDHVIRVQISLQMLDL